MSSDVRIAVKPEEVGRMLAHSSDEDQAEFLNAFANELREVCRSLNGAQMQLTYAKDYLTPRTKEVLGIE